VLKLERLKVKIIFLDFDGVLNSLDAILHSGSYGGLTPLFKKHVEVVEFVIKHTNAKIVISSTWRLGNTLKQLQELLPTLPIIDVTPIFQDKIRGLEIQVWLDSNKELCVENFLIIDDDNDMGDLKSKLVLTKFDYGLTYVEAEKCIEMLNGNNDSIWNNRVVIQDAIIPGCHRKKENINEDINNLVCSLSRTEKEQTNE